MKMISLLMAALLQDPKPVSFAGDVAPILKANCAGCHNPQKAKGRLDLTTYAMLRQGGEQGDPIVPGDPDRSFLIEQISGAEPAMPDDGDPLKPEQVALIARWIKEGARDDSPAAPAARRSAPELYDALPVVSKLAFSPDGKVLAVTGYHEVLLHRADGSGIVARLGGASPRIQSLAFSADGKRLAVCGGAPAEFGEIQLWDVEAGKPAGAYKIGRDVLFGVSFSPDGARVAFAGPDKVVRVIAAADGAEQVAFGNHTDGVFATAFTTDGKRLVSASKDRAIKLIDLSNGQFIDDINKLLEPVLSMARHPKADQVVYGGALGTPRIYKISDNQGRTAANNDTNLLRELERQPGPVEAVAWSPDGSKVAVGGVGAEARVYNAGDGKRLATLGGHGGAVFAIAFHPDGGRIATGGFDGQVRIFEAADGKLVTSFPSAPLKAPKQAKSE
jgi:WD40 repeat protein